MSAQRCDECRACPKPCDSCAQRERRRKREFRARKKADGVCMDCTLPADHDSVFCDAHLERHNAHSRASYHRCGRPDRKRRAASYQ